MADKTKAKAAPAPDSRVEGRVEAMHAGYKLIGGRLKGKCHAVAFFGTRRIHATIGDTVEEAMAALVVELDEQRAVREAARTDGIPTGTEFADAFKAVADELTSGTMAIIAIHRHQPGAAATVDDLSRRSGRTKQAVVAAYGRLGRKLRDHLGFRPGGVEGLSKTLADVLTLALIEDRRGKTGPTLRLRSEVIAALDSK